MKKMIADQPASAAPPLLIVGSDQKSRDILVTTLTREGYACHSASSATHAQSLLKTTHYDLLLGEVFPLDKSNIDWCRYIESLYPDMGIIAISTIESVKVARQVTNLNICGHIFKPVNRRQAIIAVAQALQMQQLKQVVKQHRQMIADFKADHHEKDKACQALDNALNVLLKKREQDKLDLGDQVLGNIRKIIIPNLERLQKLRLSPRHQHLLGLIQMNLEEIASPFINTLSSAYPTLTPNEVQVADLIKQGKRTKEIAAILNLSTNTIMTYRYNIRTKLGLKNKKTHLGAYLNTFK